MRAIGTWGIDCFRKETHHCRSSSSKTLLVFCSKKGIKERRRRRVHSCRGGSILCLMDWWRPAPYPLANGLSQNSDSYLSFFFYPSSNDVAFLFFLRFFLFFFFSNCIRPFLSLLDFIQLGTIFLSFFPFSWRQSAVFRSTSWSRWQKSARKGKEFNLVRDVSLQSRTNSLSIYHTDERTPQSAILLLPFTSLLVPVLWAHK